MDFQIDFQFPKVFLRYSPIRTTIIEESFKYVCHDKFYKLANNEDPTCKYNFSTDSTGTPDLLVWGDSHVNAFSDAFIGAAQKLQLNVWVASLGTCPPSIGIEQPAVNPAIKMLTF